MSFLLPLSGLAGRAPGRREVNVWVSRNVAPSAKVRVNLNTRNVRLVHVVALPIDGAKWLVNVDRQQARPSATGPALRAFDVNMPGKGQRPNPNQADTFYSKGINLPPMPPGVYLLDFAGGERPAWAVVNVTNLAVVVKRSPRRALVWVTDFRNGAIVPGASVTAYRRNGEAARRIRTGADGVALTDLTPGEETFVIRRGADLAGVPTAQGDPDGGLRAHFQTDRPIYRPGQRVRFKAILRRTRGQGYAVVAGKACTVGIRDPKDNALDEVRLTSTAMGSVEGAFDLPEEGMTGAYTLVLKTGNDTAYQTLTVAEYRKPEFKVDVRPLAKRYLAGDEVAFEVDAATYFGAPVPQAAIHYRARRSGMAFAAGDPSERFFYSGDGNLYARDTYAADAFIGEDTVYADANGKAVIRLGTDRAAGDATVSIACDVTDASRRQVSGGASVPVYGASVRLSLSTSLVYATLGSLIPVTIRAVDLDGRPTAATVSLVLKRPYDDEKTGERKERELTRTSVRVPASGVDTIDLPAKEQGEIRIDATAQDSTKRTARASLGIDVEGDFAAPKKEKEAPSLDVLLDKRVYEPGQRAKALVRTNNPGLPVLLVAEGGDIWGYKVLPNARAARTWVVTTSTRLSPNAYVAAEQWVRGQLVSANAILPVPDRTKALKVEATPDKKDYRPGDRATYTVRTTDGKGKPVAAEVAVAVVDEAIYALSPDVTPDLYGLYWGLRPDGVSMAASAPEELSGGAYQRVSTVAPLRQRFEDTAFWGPTVVTDGKGLATVAFEMPGNLTTWRATARGVTMDTSVGTGTSTVQASRPVTLRLATPRQIVRGDRLTMIGTVDNRSDAAHDFEVSLDAAGIALEGMPKRTIHVGAKGEGKVEWTLRADAIPPTGEARLIGQAVATDRRIADDADALQVDLRVVPNGLPERTLVGGIVGKEATAALTLPGDRIEPASAVTVEVRAGLTPVLREAADETLRSPRYGSVSAADQLEVAAATGVGGGEKPVRESLALLSRTQRPDGWGRWESAPADPVVTARVASALASAQGAGIRVFEGLLRATREATFARYNATDLWEHKAPLAAALARLGDPRGKDLVGEVLKRGTDLSPDARLRLAEGLLAVGRKEAAEGLVRGVLKDAPAGETETFVPAGEGTEWNATDLETTAEALFALAKLGVEPRTQAALARWLVAPDQGWRSSDEDASLARALAAYLAVHPEGARLGEVSVEVNGTRVAARPSSVAESVTAQVPRELLKNGGERDRDPSDGRGRGVVRRGRAGLPARADRDDGGVARPPTLRGEERRGHMGRVGPSRASRRTGALYGGGVGRWHPRRAEGDRADPGGLRVHRGRVGDRGIPRGSRRRGGAHSDELGDAADVPLLPAGGVGGDARRPPGDGGVPPSPPGARPHRAGSDRGRGATMIPLLAALALAPPVPGSRLDPFDLRTLEGVPYRWRPGRTTVLSFCAFWCDTWKDQLPRVREALRTTRGLPVEYATISVDGRWTERAKAAAAGTMLGDPGGAWSHAVGIDRVPYTLVVAPSGRVAWTAYGTVRTVELVDAVRESVADRAPAGGRLYLTFDDFPADRLSDELLDVLRAEGAKATLFCVGSKARALGEILRRAVREGHALAIGAWSPDGDRPELARCVAALRDASGRTPDLVRPPGSEKLLTLTGGALAFPVDDPYDATRPGVDELVRRVLMRVKPNAVIQLHAGVEDTVRALPEIIRNLRERGFTFETMVANPSPREAIRGLSKTRSHS